MIAFVPIINGLGFAYIGAKKFNNNWIKEGLIYEMPWFLMFLFLYVDGIATFFAGLGLLMMLVCIIRTFWVLFKGDELLVIDGENSIGRKTSSSYWVIFSFIMFLNGIGLIIVGLNRNRQRWALEGAFFELLWVLVFIFAGLVDFLGEFTISLAMIGWILSIIITFVVYFEEKRMDNGFISPPEPAVSVQQSEPIVEPVTSSPEIIPEFEGYNVQINDLKNTFDHKEENITGMINKRFESQGLTHNRFISVIDSCHKIFYHNANSATSIIEMAPEYSERLDETVKGKISVMESINNEMNNLIEELIIHDGDNEKSEEDLKELFANMDNLISSVKDYK